MDLSRHAGQLLSVGACAFLAVTACSTGEDGSSQDVRDDRPNVVIIISDDQHYSTMEYIPRTRARIFEEGVEFSRGYVTTARCGPSRSSVLTGMYAHNHGVVANKDLLEEETFVRRLHESGYYTGLVGKYLNSYPLPEEEALRPEDSAPLPEFDSWVALASGTKNADYFDTSLNVDGKWVERKGYQTYLLRDYALKFLKRAVRQDRPFFLLFGAYAPHKPAIPAPGDEELYLDEPPYRPPNYNEEDISDKPEWFQERWQPLSTGWTDYLDTKYLSQIQTLNALDVAVEDIIEALEGYGVLDETLVIYLSDNGHFFGEHRMTSGKVFAYEEGIRVPFALRYPPLVPEPYRESRIVANIDIAPTIYELAGIPVPPGVDGLSLVPLLQGGDDWRDGLIIEGWPEEKHAAPPYMAYHTSQYVYVETEGDIAELYDLETDPYQMENQIDNPAYADIIAALKERLAEERAKVRPTPTPVASD
jgi:N-acetylglucosamine-6-sulfatase